MDEFYDRDSVGITRIVLHTGRVGSKVHEMLEAAREIELASKKFEVGAPIFHGSKIVGFIYDESGAFISEGTFSIAPISKPIERPLRNDGKPKKERQEEPFYVSKTKRKRR